MCLSVRRSDSVRSKSKATLTGCGRRTDPNVSGDYTIALQMNGGNTERLFVTVTP